MILKDAEIFAAGEWPGLNAKGIVFTTADLDSIVSSFMALNLAGRVPLKLGHDGQDPRLGDGAPALGWIESVRRDGNRLLADIKLTSDKLSEMIKAGAYKFVSAELIRNVEAGSRRIPWVLDAVALLGATQPAVGILKELQASMSQFKRAAFRHRGFATFKREDKLINDTGVKHDMDEAQVQALVAAQVKAATDAVATKFTAQVTELTTKLSTAEADAKKAQAASHRFAVMAPIENAIAAGKINAAAKERFATLNGIADDGKVMLSNPAMAEEFVKSVEDLKQFKGPGAPSRKVAGEAEDTVDFSKMTCAEVMQFKCDKEVIKFGGKPDVFEDLERANARVLKSDKHLAQQYFADPQALYEAPSSKEA